MNVILFLAVVFAAILSAQYLVNMIKKGYKNIFGAHMLSSIEQYPGSRDGQSAEEIYNYAKKMPQEMQDIYLKKVLPSYEDRQQFKDIVQMNSVDNIYLNKPNTDLQSKSSINNRSIFNMITDAIKPKSNKINPI